MASVQLVRLASVKTAARRASSGGVSSTESETTTNSLGLFAYNFRRSFVPEDRASGSSSHGGGEDRQKVRVEVFAHGSLGKEAVLVAYLSNSVLLVISIGGKGLGTAAVGGGNRLRSWLLDWPVAGRIQGLCVSPDLQCVLCVTEHLEGVYILPVNNLGAREDAQQSTATGQFTDSGSSLYSDDNIEETTDKKDKKYRDAGSGNMGRSSAAAVAGASGPTAARLPPRAAAATAFPSLLHLASQGQRRRAAVDGEVAYPAAEPIFVASLARRGGGDGSGKGSRRDKRHSTGSGGGGRTSSADGGSRHQPRSKPFQCIWWAARNGDHFAIIGGPDGEVYFLDLERLDSWVVAPPTPTMARGRVCAFTIVEDLAGTQLRPTPPRPGGGLEHDGILSPTRSATTSFVEGELLENTFRHLVAVLETGAVFVVLLERGKPWGSNDSDYGDGGEGDAEENVTSKGGGGGEGESIDKTSSSKGGSDSSVIGRSARGRDSKYTRLGADKTGQAEFEPAWLDVGRGAGGGGGGGMGVRAVPSAGGSRRSSSPGGASACSRLHMSVVSRAWGNKCTVKILRLTASPDGEGVDQQSGVKKLRTETVRQVTLPVDHTSPEKHSLAAVDGSCNWAVLANPPSDGTPARVTIAAVGGSERPASHAAVHVFTLPHGEHVGGIALLPLGTDGDKVSQLEGMSESKGNKGSWGLLWSEFCIYRIDLDSNDEETLPKTEDKGSATLPESPTLPLLPPRLSQSPSNRVTGATCEVVAVSAAFQRPPAASIRRAHEMHSAGRLSEAVLVAMEALGWSQSSTVTDSREGVSRSFGQEDNTSGGGVTARMVREDLANSLVKWLVALHVRLPSADRSSAVPSAQQEGKSATGNSADTESSIRGFDDGSLARKRPTRRGGASQEHDVRRGPKPKAYHPAQRPSKGGPKHGAATAEKTSQPAPPAAVKSTPTTSLLEHYLLSSSDYDPVLATKLLHSHGEDDLAVIAGTSRGGMAILGTLRVLAESTWTPRLGPRAVEALCSDTTGTAAREAVRAGEGALFAALGPCLQSRLLLSDRSIMFGRVAQVGDPNTTARSASLPAGGGMATGVGDKKEFVEVAAVAGVHSHLGSIIFTLSAETISGTIFRLAQWCNEDAPCPIASHPEEGNEEAFPSQPEAVYRRRCGPSPSAAAVEALELLLDALCELSGRDPPPGENHRCAWLYAGCLVDVWRRRGVAKATPPAHEAVTDAAPAVYCSPLTEEVAKNVLNCNDKEWNLGPETVEGKSGAEPPLGWTQTTSFLCSILADEGFSGGSSEGGSERDGGLPAAARQALLRILPVVRGWHNPVRVLMRSRVAGCWSAMAVELELSGNGREAATAMLHGVVALLQEEHQNDTPPGETTRIISGKGRSLRHRNSHGELGDPASVIARGKNKPAASAALLRIIGTYAFQVDGSSGRNDESGGKITSFPSMVAPFYVILARASILAEALCVWKSFELALPSLETFLRPRLDVRDDTRVLTAVFFPQLSPDMARSSNASSRPPLEVGAGDLKEGRKRNAGGGIGFTATLLGPNPLQVDSASGLGLSPRFFLALTRAGRTLSALFVAPSPTSRPSSEDVTGNNTNCSSRRSNQGGGLGFGSPLASLLLEHRAGGGEVLAGSPVHDLSNGGTRDGSTRGGMSTSREGSSGTPGGGTWPPPDSRSGFATTWAGANASERCLPAADVDANGDEAVVWFSCGHRYSRGHLLRTVVPSCVSSLRQSTSSLQCIQQVLTLEYEKRIAGAACPECAVKELGRLVAGLRPAAAAATGSAVVGGGIPSPPPPASRLQSHERSRVR